MMVWLKTLAVAAMMSFMVVFVACESEGPAEQAGEKVDEAVEETEDEMEQVGEELEEAADEVEDEMN